MTTRTDKFFVPKTSYNTGIDKPDFRDIFNGFNSDVKLTNVTKEPNGYMIELEANETHSIFNDITDSNPLRLYFNEINYLIVCLYSKSVNKNQRIIKGLC